MLLFYEGGGCVKKFHTLGNFVNVPSESESCSYTVLEAMANGCIVFASIVDGNRELVSHEITGMLHEYNDFSALIRHSTERRSESKTVNIL